MTATEHAVDVKRSREDLAATVTAAVGGDEAAFSELVTRHRRELHAHCNRMLRSPEDSEDLVQETFLRAWRSRASFRGNASFRTWLYRIATNACHDALDGRLRRPQRAGRPGEELLDERMPAGDAEPDATVVSQETAELAFMAAIQHLPPKQRAVLVLQGVLGFSARDTASMLEASVPSVNSALQRARSTLRHRLPAQRLEWARHADASEEERALLQRYLEAIERADAEAFVDEALDGWASVKIKGVRESKGNGRWP